MTVLAYVWLAVAIAMGVVEGATAALVSVWFAGGAIAAFLAALLGAGFPVQLVLFDLMLVTWYAINKAMSRWSAE